MFRKTSIATAITLAALAFVAPPTLAQAPNEHPIVFESDRDGDLEIYAIGPGGHAIVQLTDNEAADYDPAVSPDGRTIAFVSERDGTPTLYRMAADGTIPTPIATFAGEGQAITVFGPAWSPDGATIAFFTNRDTAGMGIDLSFNHEIYTVRDDGTGLTRLTEAPGANDGSPTWSPDGTRIAFASDRDGDFEIFVMDADGGSVVQLTDSAGFDGEPTWASGGDRIAFHSDRGGSADIFHMTDVGAGAVALTALVGDATSPAYAPDGRIAFEFAGDVWMMDGDGSDLAQLTSGSPGDDDPAAAPLVTISHPVGLVDPSTGLWHLKETNGAWSSFYYGNPGDRPFTGDWDCDGEDTPGLYRQADGFVYLRNSNSQGVADVEFFFGDPGDLPIAGDFDGDGCDTVSVYRPSTGQVFIIDELGSAGGGLGVADHMYYFGNPGDQPFTGDFDGDGVDTVGLYRRGAGLVYYRNSNSQGVADASFLFGNPGDRFVTADWTGGGIDSPGVFRPSTSSFHLKYANAVGMADEWFPFYAGENWIPVAGEFLSAAD